ncbi:hypothetical protein EYZ11_002392 [Aspergillus tanneri]|uniref:Diphthine--ammonia ligase n=1 Tax=Aspergillus tanneri TaxID=1220188 RepID=A0A4V3UQ88_9EURO|nr:hypothetical protein EYZ11_002392 [Aspergillus tanneri]
MSSVSNPQPSSTGLNVIALISGGKDSLYSILHCIRNGHKVIALANLHPAPRNNVTATSSLDENEEDDIDSFMYQTIGHSVIPLYESALGIPLYRAPITGGVVDTSRIYRSEATDQMAENETRDETESLIPLLRRIKHAHPEANAVSAGAILSTYQRTRIENVAARLGLVPLAWLWMYPSLPPPVERAEASAVSSDVADAGLLEDMAAVGCEARIIKVASGGLDEGFLWGDVSSTDGAPRRRIARGMKRFAAAEDLRGAILGEGGEYESLALDGPAFLWKRRIEIEEKEVKSGEGGVGFMRLKGARCVSKEVVDQGNITPGSVRRPALLDEAFAGALDGLLSSSAGTEDVEPTTGQPEGIECECPEMTQSRNVRTWTISNITAPEAGPEAAKQMGAIVQKILNILGSTVHDFPSMNDVYVSLFKKPNPPARATVACGGSLPEGVKVMVSLVVDLGHRDLRQGLHVQSRSYWAPANIGPYSQATSIPLQKEERLVYIAGQIPLEPASMELVNRSTASEPQWFENYALRAVLALQHLWRIGAAMHVDWWVGAVAFLSGTDAIHKKAEIAWRLWKSMHNQREEDDGEEEDSILDAWDIKYGREAHEQRNTAGTPTLPNFSVIQSDVLVPAFFAVQVEELPRSSDIEWQGLGCRCDEVTLAAEDVDFGRRVDASTKNLHYTAIEIDMRQSGKSVEACLRRVLEIYTEQQGNSHAIVYTTQSLPRDLRPGQFVPCKSIWGRQGRRLAAGVILQRWKDTE